MPAGSCEAGLGVSAKMKVTSSGRRKKRGFMGNLARSCRIEAALAMPDALSRGISSDPLHLPPKRLELSLFRGKR